MFLDEESSVREKRCARHKLDHALPGSNNAVTSVYNMQ